MIKYHDYWIFTYLACNLERESLHQLVYILKSGRRLTILTLGKKSVRLVRSTIAILIIYYMGGTTGTIVINLYTGFTQGETPDSIYYYFLNKTLLIFLLQNLCNYNLFIYLLLNIIKSIILKSNY